MTPSWGAKSGSWDSPKMMSKIIKRLTFDIFLALFWAPQGGCRSKHLEKRVIFWAQAGGCQNYSKLKKKQKNGPLFGYPKIGPLRALKMTSKMTPKWSPKWTPKLTQN